MNQINYFQKLIHQELIGLINSTHTKLTKILHQLFFTLRDKIGCSFVIVTHNELLTKQSDQIISLKDGKII